jgi:hypothetical protein
VSDETKPWWQSTTIWGALGAAVIAMMGVLGEAVSAGDVAAVAGHADRIAGAVLAIVAIWGRIRANRRVR